jgi:hypothetical protein
MMRFLGLVCWAIVALGVAWVLSQLFGCGGEAFTVATALEAPSALDAGELLGITEDAERGGQDSPGVFPNRTQDADLPDVDGGRILEDIDGGEPDRVFPNGTQDASDLPDAEPLADAPSAVETSTPPKSCVVAGECPACTGIEPPCCSSANLCGCLVAATYCR